MAHEKGNAPREMKTLPDFKGLEPDRQQMLTFIESTLKERGDQFTHEFNDRLKKIAPELPATNGEGYSSEAMHAVEQRYNLLRQMLEENNSQQTEESEWKQAA